MYTMFALSYYFESACLVVKEIDIYIYLLWRVREGRYIASTETTRMRSEILCLFASVCLCDDGETSTQYHMKD